MKQVVFSRGSAARTVDAPVPAPKRGTILVRTHFSAVSVGTERAAGVGGTNIIRKALEKPQQIKQVVSMALREGVTVAAQRVSAALGAWMPSGYSNAGVVVDDDGLTVVDTLMVRSQWEPFAEAVHALDRPVRRIVLTHAHVDHVGGTKAFPHAAVYATPVTSALLDQDMPIDAYKAFMPAFADEFDELAEIGTRPASHLVDGAVRERRSRGAVQRVGRGDATVRRLAVPE